jgi:hypothetical protein
MTLAGATSVAVGSGFITGGLVAFIVHPGLRRSWLFLAGLLGAFAGALTCAVFAFLALLTFSDSPSDAVVLTLVVEGTTVVGVVLARWLQDSLQLPGSVDALLESHPAGGAAQVWLIGVALALFLIYVGLDGAISAKATIGTTLFHSDVEGLPAVAYGIGWTAVGMFLHFHYFWTSHFRLRPYSRIGKLVSVVAASVGFIIAFGAAPLGGAP